MEAGVYWGGLRDSRERASPLLEGIFPAYTGVPVFCRFWLMSPELKRLFPADSRILAGGTLADGLGILKQLP